MRLRIIAVGRDRKDPLCAAADDYVARVARTQSIDLVEVKEEPALRAAPVSILKRAEAERIRRLLSPKDLVVALDERGREWTSTGLADVLRRWRDEGVPSVVFIVGGPNGLDPDLVKGAKHVWSLSNLTLPHRLARVLVAEQIYRAWTIVRGEPYHK